MSTKAKCLALAKEHNMEIEIGASLDEYDICIPEGFTLEDYEGARTGLSASGYDNAKEMWKGCYEDLQTCVAYQPWFKIPEEWK
jgi:hypothetical protein